MVRVWRENFINRRVPQKGGCRYADIDKLIGKMGMATTKVRNHTKVVCSTVENEVYSNTAAEGDVTVLHGCIANELHCFQSEMKRYSSETVSFLLLIYSLTCSAVSRKDIPQRPRLVQDALDNNKSVYYFGLGSNMSREKLEGRSPDGQLIKIQRMEPAVVVLRIDRLGDFAFDLEADEERLEERRSGRPDPFGNRHCVANSVPKGIGNEK